MKVLIISFILSMGFCVDTHASFFSSLFGIDWSALQPAPVTMVGPRPQLTLGTAYFPMTNSFVSLTALSTPKVVVDCGNSVSACGATAPVCCAPGYSCSNNSCVKETVKQAIVATTQEEIDYRTTLLAYSNQELYDASIAGKVGKCVIADATTCTDCACSAYLHSNLIGSLGMNGYPKNPSSGDSTGCISSTCYGGYESNMCGSGSLVDFGANMVRAAINDSLDPCQLWGDQGYVASLPSIDDNEVSLHNKNLVFAKDGSKIRCGLKFKKNQKQEEIVCDGVKYTKFVEIPSAAFCLSAFRTRIANNPDEDIAQYSNSDSLTNFNDNLGITKKHNKLFKLLLGHFHMIPQHFDMHPGLVGRPNVNFAKISNDNGVTNNYADENTALLVGHIQSFKSSLSLKSSFAPKIFNDAVTETGIPVYQMATAKALPAMHSLFAEHFTQLSSLGGATLNNGHVVGYGQVKLQHDYINTIDLCKLQADMNTAALVQPSRSPAAEITTSTPKATYSPVNTAAQAQFQQ